MAIQSTSKIIPNLWFDHQAEEAANLYVSIFDRSKIDIPTLKQAYEQGALPTT